MVAVELIKVLPSCCCQVFAAVLHSSLGQVLPFGVSFAHHFVSSASQAPSYSLLFSVFEPIAIEPRDLH